MENLCELIMTKRGIRQVSAQQYCSTIFKVLRDNDGDKGMFLNYDRVYNYLEKQAKPTTKRNILTAIVVYLRVSDLGNDELLTKYNDLLKSYSTTIDEKIKNGEKTDGQHENWASWDEILTVGKKMQFRMKGIDKESTEYFDAFQDYLIYSIYTQIPPLRNDYAGMKIYTPKAFKAMSETEQAKGNYLVASPQTVEYFIVNEYKTSDKYGQIKIELAKYPVVVGILKQWLKMNKGTDFLIDTKNGINLPMTPINLTKRLQRIFKKYLDKNISTSILRHSYLSSKYGDTLDERKEDSAIMGHNLSMQDNYIKN